MKQSFVESGERHGRCAHPGPGRTHLTLLLLPLLLLTGCSPPPPGYSRNESTLWPFDNQWLPGSSHPDHPRIHAASQPDSWEAEPGYVFLNHTAASSQPGPVNWQAGRAHPTYEHVRAADRQGAWVAEPGYVFLQRLVTVPGEAGPVKWQAGRSHPHYPHITSYVNEGTWIANPGFKFLKTVQYQYSFYDVVDRLPLDPSVKLNWYADLPHPNCPQLVSASETGTWRAASGYRLLSADGFDVVRDEPASGPSAGRFFGNLLVAIVAHGYTHPGEDDGLAASAGRAVAGGVRDIALENAANELVGNSGQQEVLSCDYWKLPREIGRAHV